MKYCLKTIYCKVADITKATTLLLSLVLSSIGSPLLAENFPKPDELQRDVDFWVRVYTEIDTKSGFIHDSHNLGIVYETIKIRGSRRSNKKKVKKVKARYAIILKKLAAGKRKNLSSDEQRVLKLWGKNVSAERLRLAAKSLRFQLGQSNRFREGLIRSGEWRPFIDQTLKDLQMPAELAALPHVESSFNPEAYSRVGAAGIWQFIRSTGRRYMQIDYIVDERMDPFSSTLAAAKLLRHNYSVTNSWPLALTAYNHGVASMRRAINKLGTTDIAIIVRNYKGRAFGFASRNFYVAFLAALEIDQNPGKYFGSLRLAKPYDYEFVKTEEYLLASTVANLFGISVDALRHHNRSLMQPVWNESKRIPKGFQLRIPKGISNLPAKDLLATIPSGERFDKQTPDIFHKVVRGDTISGIAARYGHRVSEIKSLNGIGNSHLIRVGQTLRLPVKDGVMIASVETKTAKVAPVESTSMVESPKQEVQADAKILAAPDIVPESVIEKSPEVVTTVPTIDESEIQAVSSVEVAIESLAEPETLTEAESVAETAPEIAKYAALLSDPSDYTVAENQTIEVQASETLGHYAEWLDIRASRLRKINNMRFSKPVVIGRRLKMDFTRVAKEEFERRRIAYQKTLQEEFFTHYRIGTTSQHVIREGESLWILALRKFKIPIWLLRQHNPDVDFDRVRPGVEIVVPQLIEVSAEDPGEVVGESIQIESSST